MDAIATAGDKQKAPLTSDGTSPTSVPEARRDEPLSEVVADGGGAAVESGSGGGGEDEQVEKFYALLANIRALRNLYGGGGDGGGSPSRKRARGAEPPWKPAFRIEDFRGVDDAWCAKKKERRDRVERQRPENNAADGEVVEEKDQVSASQRARVLATDL